MTQIEQLKLLTGEQNESLLELLLERAKAAILNHCRRDDFPEQLIPAQVELASVYYNRQGYEGVAAEKEGGVSITYDVSREGGVTETITLQLERYRKIGVVHSAQAQ
jgi:hypothetical protein